MPEVHGDQGSQLIRPVRGILAGAIVFVVMLMLPAPDGLPAEAWRTAAVVALMAIWWITEALPIYATAMLPLVLFPMLGIADIATAAAPYGNPIVFLFLGGAMLAIAIQRWNLHQRIALAILGRVGTGASRLVGGFMVATAFLSMWVSNTAAALVMLPMALAVIAMLKECDDPALDSGKLNTVLMLGVAYGASFGGMSTIIGTPPNALLVAFMEQTYGIQISFAAWLAFGLPMAIVLLLISWLLLTRVSYRLTSTAICGAGELIQQRRAGLGPVSTGEKIVSIVFFVVAAAWVLSPLINAAVPGLNLTDATIAMTGAVLLFLIPVNWRKNEFVLNWESAAKAPWGILLLLGGGLSLAEATSSSGLADVAGTWLVGMDRAPFWLVLLAVVTVVVILSEVASNTATAATLLPVAAAVALALGVDPTLLCIPVTLAASFGFMLPVATPPNAIVFSSGYVTASQMARAGILLDLACIVVLVLAAYSGMLTLFDVALSGPQP